MNVKGTLVPPFFDGRVSLREGDPFAIRVAPGEYKFHVFTSSSRTAFGSTSSILDAAFLRGPTGFPRRFPVPATRYRP